jgi:hypothetical protein
MSKHAVLNDPDVVEASEALISVATALAAGVVLARVRRRAREAYGD